MGVPRSGRGAEGLSSGSWRAHHSVTSGKQPVGDFSQLSVPRDSANLHSLSAREWTLQDSGPKKKKESCKNKITGTVFIKFLILWEEEKRNGFLLQCGPCSWILLESYRSRHAAFFSYLDLIRQDTWKGWPPPPAPRLCPFLFCFVDIFPGFSWHIELTSCYFNKHYSVLLPELPLNQGNKTAFK